jgi:ketosteroid isomerase-like protein
MPRISTALMALLLASPAMAAPRGDAAAARATILERFDAALRGDVATLDRLLADDLDYCTFRGDCETKAQYIGEVKSGRLKYVSIQPTVDRVKLYADTATVTGHATVTAVRDGVEHTIHISWAGVLAWRDARWQLTTWTSTLLEGAAK